MKKNVLLQKFIFMRKTALFAILAMMIFCSCGNSGKEKKDNGRSTATDSLSIESKVFVKQLSYRDFIRKVWDFEKYPDSFAYEGKLPCVIDFYAVWCGPCRKLLPTIEKLAEEYDGRVSFYKVDTDVEQKLATILKVRNIPTVYFLEEGKQPSYSVGAKDEIYFRTKINQMLNE